MLAAAFGPNSIEHWPVTTDWEAAIATAISLLEADQRVTSDYLL